MKPLIFAALAAAAVAYAAAAPAFTPVVTAPYAFSWGVMASIQKYFCTRCGQSNTSNGGSTGVVNGVSVPLDRHGTFTGWPD